MNTEEEFLLIGGTRDGERVSIPIEFKIYTFQEKQELEWHPLMEMDYLHTVRTENYIKETILVEGKYLYFFRSEDISIFAAMCKLFAGYSSTSSISPRGEAE